MKTLQEIFDFGLAHIRKQGGPSLTDGSDEPRVNSIVGCLYRNKAGRSCIVGGFIADEDYRPAFDEACSAGVCSLILNEASFREALLNARVDVDDDEVAELLGDMQTAHDSMASSIPFTSPMDGFELRMEDIAKHCRLVYTPPQGVPA